MRDDIEEIMFTPEQIQSKVAELGMQISDDYRDKNPLVVCVLKGASLFMADLVRNISIPIEMDFMAISSYGASTQSSGVVRIMKDLETGLENRHVIIVEDIVDTGLTLSYLRDSLLRRNASSVRIVTLFDKPSGRKIEIIPDYSGFQVPNAFIVGYGLDYSEKYRNLPFVGILKPEIYS
ncbi:hypoxanthine phosphoribosyltransferase [Effusibacillus dendaii]|uniref:Hypoxanthine phosphoribosyltransferase n=1 Tax=Effusibacillus dendaii TaxID=2743772 RepID=A0A7I8DB37_9BACL|nr:hypoxanthine phosphoribosyltransferase [Effusibacillus dendaii]BCJ87388.1 hypoxanthine phosphoribosyltransferase [Effusibacillus dendaii]